MDKNKKSGEKRGIIYQFLFGLWFLFGMLAMVWFVYNVGFVPVFIAMLIISIVLFVILLYPVSKKTG